MEFKYKSNPVSETSENELKVITLGGTTAVTKNMTVYEYGNDIIVVDCGFGFPDSEMLGVDVVLPDITYLKQNESKIRGIVISHGHDDHIGALPYVLKDLNVSVYCTKLVQGLIQVKLKEKDMLNGTSLKLIDPDGPGIQLGAFKIDYFRVNHSIPEACGLSIKCPAGRVFHCADFKFDWTPVLDKPFDVNKMVELSEGGVDLLLSDSLGATTEGYARSEKHIEDTFDELLNKAEGRQVFITTVSSNVSRLAQAISSAHKHGRKVVISGRSIDQVTEVNVRLGYLKVDKSIFVPKEKSRKFKQSELLYIVAGAYGQSDSAISRIARGEHRDITLEDGAYVIFSADPNPPGVRDDVDVLIDRLTLKNSIVIYSEVQENLHVSGHGLTGDLKLMAALAKPKYFLPIGGTVKHMRAYKNMIADMGYKGENVFELLEGESVVMKKGEVTRGEKIEVSNVFVDGSIIGDVGEKVIEDRQALATDGIVVAVVAVNDKEEVVNVEVVTRGFVYVKESRGLLNDASNVIKNVFSQSKKDNLSFLKSKIEESLEKFLYKKTGREPLVIVNIVKV